MAAVYLVQGGCGKAGKLWYASVETKVTLIDLDGLVYPFISD